MSIVVRGGSLVPDGDFDVECTSCGATYSLDDYDE